MARHQPAALDRRARWHATFEGPPARDAPLGAIMEAQAPVRRLRPDPIDDATVLTLLDLASRATAGQRRRCEFVVVRDPDVRHQIARSYRQGWSVYRRVLHSRLGDDA